MAASFVFNTAPRIIFRDGALSDIASLVGPLLGERVLLVTDPGLRKLGLIEPPLANLRQAGIDVTVFDQVEADPSLATLMKAVDEGRRGRCSGVLGLGGGSSLDVAKLAALLLGSEEDIDGLWGVGNAKGPRLPLVLAPTTAGTGSEVTPVAIITVGGDEKRGVSSAINLPDIALLDPLVTIRLPPHITAATGIDAMVHAIEAYASINPSNNPISKALGREALRLLGRNIRQAVSSGSDLEARRGMLLGSMLAGQAFANSPVAAVHALAYPIGGSFHITHGLSNALVLPHVLRFNSAVAAPIYAEIAADAFPNIAEVEGSARCAAFIEAISELSMGLGLASRLRDVGVPSEALGGMASDAMKHQRLRVNNPRPVCESDALAIYEAAW